MKGIKRIVALMMTAVMITTMVPISAEAATKKKGTVKSVTIKNLDTKTLVLKKGKTFKLKTKVNVTGKVSKKVTYSSSNKKVATVSKSGKIKAVKKGTAKITVKSVANSKKKVTITVKVGTPVKKVKLNKKKVTAYVGDTVKLKATFTPKKPTIKKVTFTSNKKSVATVDKKGVVTCVGKGTAKITVKATDGSGKKAVCKITVKENPNTENTTTENATTERTTTEASTTEEKNPTETPEDEVVMGDDLSYEGYTLDWSDEFDGEELNRENWNVELHDPGWVNAELQEYVDSEKNIYLEDGKLVLNPIQTKNEDGTYSYTSGRVNTQNKKTYTYGMFEVKAKVPEGTGYLPAFWLMANDENVYGQWPRCGEIDIMEVHGSDTDTSYGTIHYGNPHQEQQGTYSLAQGSYSEQYHTFTCEWEPGKITWYVDGVKFHEANDWYSATEGGGTISYPAPFDQPFYIILNLAVGGSWVGYPDDETFESQPYMIDYVRVYQKDEGYDDSNVVAPEKEEVVLRAPDENGNYLLNGDFSDVEDLTTAEAWQFKTANGGVGETVISTGDAATPAIEGNSAIVTTTDDGTVDYSIQLLQNDVPLIAGQTYVLSFDAYASAARTIKVNSKAPNNSWYAYLNEDVALTTEKQTYEYEFDMIHADDANCTIEFNMGNFDSTDTVVIDNVSLKIKGGTIDEEARAAINNPAKSARADGNYIYNGQFQEGNKHLGDWVIPDEADVSVTSLSDGRRLKVVVPEGGKVTISQVNVPVIAESDYALSLDAVVPATGAIDVVFLDETYEVTAGTKGNYSSKFTTPATMNNKDITITFDGAGTYYLDNVRIDEDALIKNGSFNAGFSGYEPYVYSNEMATYGVDSLSNDNAVAFDINTTGNQAWYIQLKQNGVELEKGQWYRLSLDAKSTVNRKLMFAIQRDGSKHNDDWTPYSGEKIVDLTDKYATYTIEFQMTEDTDLESVLSISMGAVGGVTVAEKHSVYIDNVVLEKIENESSDDTPADTPDEVTSIEAGVNQLAIASMTDGSWGGEKTYTANENSIVYEITDVGTEDSHIQLKQAGITLEQGETYTVSFKVNTTAARAIKVSLLDEADNYNWYAGVQKELEEGDNEVTFTFTVDKADNDGITFQISMGQMFDETQSPRVEIETAVSTMTLSDFSLVKNASVE